MNLSYSFLVASYFAIIDSSVFSRYLNPTLIGSYLVSVHPALAESHPVNLRPLLTRASRQGF